MAITETEALTETHVAAHAERRKQRQELATKAEQLIVKDIKLAKQAFARANIALAAMQPAGPRIDDWAAASEDDDEDAELRLVGSEPLSPQEEQAAKAAAAQKAALKVKRKEQMDAFDMRLDFSTISTLLPPGSDVAKIDPAALASLYQLLALWEISAPDVMFTLGGMKTVLPESLACATLLNQLLGLATAKFFDVKLTGETLLGLIVPKQCVAVMLHQIRASSVELYSQEAQSRGSTALDAIIKKRKLE